VLDGEAEDGWTPVCRRKKPEAEAVADFWREIGFPTSASRFLERSRRLATSEGMSPLICRSVEVYASSEKVASPVNSPPVRSPRRGACSSPTGVHLSRGPKMGSWRGPLPRRRITPLPILGQFLDKAAGQKIVAALIPRV
jgi:hypothetical protein